MISPFFSMPRLSPLAAVLGFSVVCARVEGEDFGNGLAFNGINQYVSVPNFSAAALSTEVTVEFWALADAVAQQAAFMLEPDQGSNRFNGHINYLNGNTYWDFGNIDGGGRVQTPNPAGTIGVWTHYAFVASQNGSFMRIYVNGVETASAATMDPFEPGTHELRIGGNTGFHFHGKLDEFRVWNRVRTVAQIRAGRFTPLAGNETGLRLYYRFDEGAGPVALNSATATGAAGNGTLINEPAWTAPSPRLGMDVNDNGNGMNFSPAHTAGWSFSVTSAMKVTSLGMFDFAQDGAGFVNPHALGLWQNDGTLLATTTMAAGTGATQVPLRNSTGSWRFVPITPVVLIPGTYRIGATFKDTDPDYISTGPTLIPSPGCVYQASWKTPSAGLVFPTSQFSTGIFGPNFQFTGLGSGVQWDANGSAAPNPVNGSGSWDTTSAVWWNGATHDAWEQGGAAIFGAGSGIPGEVSVDAPVTLRALTFEAAQGGAYTIKGPQSITLGTASTALVANAGATISAVLAGTNAGLVKSGAGTLTLTAANTYTGATTISGGTLVLSNLPAPGGIFLGNASSGSASISLQATTTVNNPITVSAQATGTASLGSTAAGTAVFTGPVTLLSDVTLTGKNPDTYPPLSFTGKTQFNGTISGPFGVNVAGPGWVQFDGTGAKSYTGPTTVLAGAKLSVWRADSLPPTPLVIQTGGFVRLEGVSLAFPGLSGGGILMGNASYGPSTVTLGAGNGDYVFDGQVNLPINLIKTGTGTQTLSRFNATRGHTTVNQGTLSLPAADLYDSGVVSIAAGARLHLSHDQEDVVNSLIVAGVSKPSGLYGAPGSANPNDTEISALSGTGRIRIVPVPMAFEQWALANGLTGSNAGLSADPDGDGSSNLAEFALGGNPTVKDSPASYSAVADVYGNGLRLFTSTIQVRSGGVISYDGNDALLRVDGITYHIEGSWNLAGFDSKVGLSVLRPGPVAPRAGYEYKTFHLDASHSYSTGFMRVWVSVP